LLVVCLLGNPIGGGGRGVVVDERGAVASAVGEQGGLEIGQHVQISLWQGSCGDGCHGEERRLEVVYPRMDMNMKSDLASLLEFIKIWRKDIG
jgi:hypothetical protein